MNDSEINQIEIDILKIMQSGTVDIKEIVYYFNRLRTREQLQKNLNLGLGTTPEEIVKNLYN